MLSPPWAGPERAQGKGWGRGTLLLVVECSQGQQAHLHTDPKGPMVSPKLSAETPPLGTASAGAGRPGRLQDAGAKIFPSV